MIKDTKKIKTLIWEYKEKKNLDYFIRVEYLVYKEKENSISKYYCELNIKNHNCILWINNIKNIFNIVWEWYKPKDIIWICKVEIIEQKKWSYEKDFDKFIDYIRVKREIHKKIGKEIAK